MKLQANGAAVETVCRGEKGNALLLLHGWGCSAEMMRGVQDAFSGRMRTAAIDFPGHGNLGKAAPPPEPWGVPEYAEMTRSVIGQLSMEPCDVVAHSFGARVAIWLAAKHPECVRRMILTGAAGIPKPRTQKQEARQRAYGLLKKAASAAEKTRLFGGAPAKWKEALVQHYGSRDYAALSPEMRATFNRVIGLDLTPCLAKIQAPTLLFWGAQDTETPLWMGRRMEEMIPDAGLVVEEGAGHFAYLERQAVFLAAARSFFSEEEHG